jgi:hypothetical protein
LKLQWSLALIAALVCASCATPPAPAVIPHTTEGYKRAVEDRLGPLWYERVRLNAEGASVGTVVASFRIPARGGRVQKVRIVSNTGNKIDELMVRIALGFLRAPPVPPAVLAQLPEDYFYFEESFTLFDKSNPPSSPIPQPKR